MGPTSGLDTKFRLYPTRRVERNYRETRVRRTPYTNHMARETIRIQFSMPAIPRITQRWPPGRLLIIMRKQPWISRLRVAARNWMSLRPERSFTVSSAWPWHCYGQVVLKNLWLGGEAAWKTHERIAAILSSDPVFDKARRWLSPTSTKQVEFTHSVYRTFYRYYATRTETYEKALAMQKRIEELRVIHHWDEKDLSFVQLALDEPMPMNLHSVGESNIHCLPLFLSKPLCLPLAFEPVINSQGSQELKAQFGPLVKHRGILGCYLQTELGHGTNVAQLETTATYIPESDEFEIHSPTLTSTKWWIGSLGKTANFGVVQAQLILPNERNVGPHLFLVQLRSLGEICHCLLSFC